MNAYEQPIGKPSTRLSVGDDQQYLQRRSLRNKETEMKSLLIATSFVVCYIFAGPTLAKVVPATTQAAPPVLAPSGEYRLDPEHSSIVFRVKHLGMAWFPMRFTRFTADLGFNAQRPERSTLNVSIDPTSIHTAVPPKPNENFDEKIATNPDWLNGKTFPKIEFVSTRIERTGPATANIFGNLTIRGVTRPFVLETVFNGSMRAHPFSRRPLLGFSGQGSLKRSDFGMTTLIPMVGDEIRIAVEAELVTK